MSPDTTTKVAILQGNATVAKLMGDFLEGSNSFEVEFLQGSPPGAARAQLVVIDIDSEGSTAQQWIRHCDGRQLPVIVTGVERSRKAYADRPWLGRPFSVHQLLALCREVLFPDERRSGEEELPPAIEVGAKALDQPTVEIPGADPALEDASTEKKAVDELLEVLDIDGTGSMILEIEDVSSDRPVGGMLVRDARRRSIAPAELEQSNPWSDVEDTEVESSDRKRTTSSVMLEGQAEVTPSSRAEVTAVSSISDLTTNDFSGAHRVASLVAEHWNRIGLTARPADRADRLQRIFTAMLRDGIDGVLEVLKRIPPVTGFSGNLETISVVDLLHTIRDRRLRGRLEVGLDGHSFVLYVDQTRLDGIESLGETTDRLFVKLLRNQGAFDETTYRHYKRLASEVHGEALEMKLRQDEAIDDTAFFQAKKEKARHLLTKMCRGKYGTFAFIEISHQSGHSWPTLPLKLSVDALLLEVLRRESSQHDLSSESLLEADLVIDSERAARLAPDALTEAERQTLDFFERGATVDKARKSLPPTEEPVARVVRRLERLELLRRLGQKESDEHPRRTPSSSGSASNLQRDAASSRDPHQRPTAVSSSWNLQVLDELNSGEDMWDDETTERTPEDLVEQTKEDVGFAAGIPDEFDPSPPDAEEDES